MYEAPKYSKTEIDTTQYKTEGETIEEKVTRLIQNKEPIKDGSTIIFTDRKEGVNPAYNVRTDRWEVAVDAMTRLMKSKLAKRQEPMIKEDAKVIDINKDGRPESIQGKASTT